MNEPKPEAQPQVHGRDDEAEQIVRAHGGWMLALANRILRDRQLSEDAVQEAFLNAFRSMDDFQGRSDLKTWLHRITVNACLSKLRKLDRQQERSIEDLMPEFDNYDCRIEGPWPTIQSAEEVAENHRLQQLVQSSIESLPDTYRVILQLRDIEGFSTSEVAGLFGISESNAKVRLHRARSALKRLLEPLLRGEST